LSEKFLITDISWGRTAVRPLPATSRRFSEIFVKDNETALPFPSSGEEFGVTRYFSELVYRQIIQMVGCHLCRDVPIPVGFLKANGLKLSPLAIHWG